MESSWMTNPYRFHITPAINIINYDVSDKDIQVFFDDTIKELLICKSKGPKHEITREVIGEEKREPFLFNIPNGGRINDIKFSTDCKYLTIKRKDDAIEITNLIDSTNIKHPCRRAKSASATNTNDYLLGYYWTNPSNLLLITRSGVELYSVTMTTTNAQVKLIKEYKKPINWFVYSPQVRILIISTGSRSSVLQGFHFMLKRSGVMKLPKFDVLPKNVDSPVSPNEIVISQIYSGLYCIHVNNKGSKKELVLYQLSKDNITPKLYIDLHTVGTISMSVIDNLIITHNFDQQISMIFDIKLRDGSSENRLNFPAAAPLPLAAPPEINPSDVYKKWKFYPPGYVVSENTGQAWKLELNLDAISASFSDRVKLVDFLLRRKNSKDLIIKTLRAAILEKEPLSVLAIIFEMLNRVLATHITELHKDSIRPLPEIPRENRDAITLSDSSGAATPTKISHSATVDITQNKTAKFWKTFVDNSEPDEEKTKNGNGNGDYVEDYSTGVLPPGMTVVNPPSLRVGIKGPKEDLSQSLKQYRIDGFMVIEQEEIYTQVFLPVEEMNVVDYKYMVAVVVEYIRCLNFQYVQVKSFVYELVIHLLVRNNRFYQLHQFLQYHVISDSLHVACQLLSLERSYPPAYQLALDMLKRLSSPDQIVEVLLTKGQVIQALRFVKNQKHEPIKVSPKRFLDAAIKSEDPTVFFTVFSYFKKQETDSTWKLYQPIFDEKVQQV